MIRWKCIICGLMFESAKTDALKHLKKYPNHHLKRIAPKGA